MIKVAESAVTFSEFPDELAICLSISNCPCKCKGCSEKHLQSDIGVELTEELIQDFIDKNKDCTLFGILGGDIDHEDVKRVAKYVKDHSKMKVGFYSGLDYIDISLLHFIDCYKIGKWIQPDKDNYKEVSCGPLSWPNTNQRYFVKDGDKLIDMTYKFRKKLNNWFNNIKG